MEFERPRLTDFQLMRLAMLLERTMYKSEHWKKLGLFDPNRQKVQFEKSVVVPQAPPAPTRPATEEEKRQAGERQRAAFGYDPAHVAKMKRIRARMESDPEFRARIEGKAKRRGPRA